MAQDTTPEKSYKPVVATQPNAWRLAAALGFVLIGVLLGSLWRPNQNAGPPPSVDTLSAEEVALAEGTRASAGEVRLTIASDDQPGRVQTIVWRRGFTVLDALLASDAQVVVTGSGEGAFVTAINGLANDGRSGSGWQYEVNNASGRVSAAVQAVEAGDRVLWRHGPYE